jgi:hypothetical protein
MDGCSATREEGEWMSKKPRVAFSWEEPDEAEVARITCSCGYVDAHERIIHEGDVWECPRCHARIRFYYAGWKYKVLRRGDAQRPVKMIKNGLLERADQQLNQRP